MMRILLTILVLVLTVAILAFHSANNATVTVTLMRQSYENVPLAYLVMISVLIGAVLTGIFALIEGMAMRIENRKLRRDLSRMGTEINYLSSEPATGPRKEPDALEAETAPPRPSKAAESVQPTVPMAPVYGSDAEEWQDDVEDDLYGDSRLT